MSNSKQSIRKQSQPGRRTEAIGLMKTTTFAGPLPPPETLQGFENVVPGAAERIIIMAEKEQDARHQMESRLTTANITMALLGIFAGLLALLIISFLIKYSIDKEYPGVASVLASTSLVGVIGVFVWFKRKKKST